MAKELNRRFIMTRVQRLGNLKPETNEVEWDQWDGMRLLIDTETGVNYFVLVANGNGTMTSIMPLIDENGNLIITKEFKEI